MADTDRIRVTHPDTGGVFETTRGQFEGVWQQKGWVETSGDTPLTDWRYQNEGGGETQPPPLAEPVAAEPATATATKPTQPAPTE